MTKAIKKGKKDVRKAVELINYKGEVYSPTKPCTTNMSEIQGALDDVKEVNLHKNSFIREFVGKMMLQKDASGDTFAYIGQLEFLSTKVLEEREVAKDAELALDGLGW